MNAVVSASTSEQEIRALVESWLSAARRGDVDSIIEHYAPNIVAYDAVLELQFKGTRAYGAHWAKCAEMCPGPMVFDLQDFTIQAARDIGFGFGLLRCGAIDEKGEEKASWMRYTGAYVKTGDGWKVVHEHFSAPFDIATEKALFDLQP